MAHDAPAGKRAGAGDAGTRRGRVGASALPPSGRTRAQGSAPAPRIGGPRELPHEPGPVLAPRSNPAAAPFIAGGPLAIPAHDPTATPNSSSGP